MRECIWECGNEKAAHINLSETTLICWCQHSSFELAVTLKLSHYSVTTFSTRVNAVCVANAWFSHIPVLAFMADIRLICNFFELPEEVIQRSTPREKSRTKTRTNCRRNYVTFSHWQKYEQTLMKITFVYVCACVPVSMCMGECVSVCVCVFVCVCVCVDIISNDK